MCDTLEISPVPSVQYLLDKLPGFVHCKIASYGLCPDFHLRTVYEMVVLNKLVQDFLIPSFAVFLISSFPGPLSQQPGPEG